MQGQGHHRTEAHRRDVGSVVSGEECIGDGAVVGLALPRGSDSAHWASSVSGSVSSSPRTSGPGDRTTGLREPFLAMLAWAAVAARGEVPAGHVANLRALSRARASLAVEHTWAGASGPSRASSTRFGSFEGRRPRSLSRTDACSSTRIAMVAG
jgi:hypothetical protein